MADAWYEHGATHLISDVVFTAATIKAVLLKNGYTPDFVNDEFLAIISGADRPSTSDALAAKSVGPNGQLHSNPIHFVTPAGGNSIVGLAVYHDTGVAATSQLLFYFDLVADGLDFVTDGLDVTLNITSFLARI